MGSCFVGWEASVVSAGGSSESSESDMTNCRGVAAEPVHVGPPPVAQQIPSALHYGTGAPHGRETVGNRNPILIDLHGTLM